MRLALIGSIALSGAFALSGCGGDDGDIRAFCDKVDEVQSADDPFAGATGDDIASTTAALEKAQGLFAEVAEVAPEEIQGDVEEAQAFFDDFVAAAQDAKSPEDFLAIATDFQEEAAAFEETSTRLEEYTTENCGDGSEGS